MEMSAQELFNSVSSPISKIKPKRILRQTRSLDPTIIRHGSGTERAPEEVENPRSSDLDSGEAGGYSKTSSESLSTSKPDLRSKTLRLKQSRSSFSSPSTPIETSPPSNFRFDYDIKGVKRNNSWDFPFLSRNPGVNSTGSTSSIFSPRKWLQKKLQQPSSDSHTVCKTQGDFTWNSMSGRTVRLKSVPIQSLSELERVRLQEVAFGRLNQDYDLGCQITIPKDGQKRKKSLRRKLDSLAKEKNKDKEIAPQAFGMPLSQVIANDRSHKQRQDSQREEHKDTSHLVSSILQFATTTTRRPNKELSSSNSSLSSTSETPYESTSPNTPEPAPRARRRGAMSVDSITDLDDSQSRLLEALQLSLPAETPSKKEKRREERLSLNPIYRQVPRLVDSCCQHLERYGLQTVGIFRVGSSKKRVRQLREEFDRGVDMTLDEEHSAHDVAALLKEFLRDMPDPLLTKELYTAFINTMLLDHEEQHTVTQLLIYLLPPCNSDTLHRLLHFLSTVAAHASDAHDKDGQEITGNKMTSLNLATIFGPNLLHKQKSSDKEFSVQSSARVEEHTAIIRVVQKMIATYETLFMVSPDLQNEVLTTLLETDPDVVDYLLRRKASQWSSPGKLQPRGVYSPSEHGFSCDSNRASSGEVSPYDNSSPVLPERSPPRHHGDSSPGSVCVPERGPTSQGSEGSHGNISECDTPSSWEGLNCHMGDEKKPVSQMLNTGGVTKCRPHPPVTHSSSNPQGEQRPRWLHKNLDQLFFLPEDQSASSTAEDLPQGSAPPGSPSFSVRPSHMDDGRPPPPYTGPPGRTGSPGPRGLLGSSMERQDWQRGRWQIWQLLSSDNTDTLPETLV